jgi:predicted PurR-regulated permease PerM
MNRLPTVQIAIWFMALVVALGVMKIAAPLFAPIVLALVMGVVLSPFSEQIDRLGTPPALSAFLTLMIALAIILVLLVMIEPVVTRAVGRAPIIWAELRDTVSTIRDTLRGLDAMSDQVEEALNDPAPGEALSDGAEEKVAVPTLTDALWLAPSFAARIMIFIGTLYFFLLSRAEVYEWLTRSDIAVSAREMLEAEHEVSRYFLTITVINAGFGTLYAAVFWWLGLPYPILWGFVAFLANYILYLGPAVFAATLFVGGIVSFDGPLSFAPGVVYICLNMIEGQFVTPSLVGRQMAVNPLLVFLSLVFWLWMWGPVGGIIAIPLLVWALALRKRRKPRDAAPARHSTPDQALQPEA